MSDLKWDIHYSLTSKQTNFKWSKDEESRYLFYCDFVNVAMSGAVDACLKDKDKDGCHGYVRGFIEMDNVHTNPPSTSGGCLVDIAGKLIDIQREYGYRILRK